MTRFEAALLDLVAFLDEHSVPYMVIGGFANLYWGVERFTRHIDLTVEVAAETLPDFMGRLQKRFAVATQDPLDFAHRNHLVRLKTRTEVEAVLLLATLPYEQAAIRRAIAVDVGVRKIRLCTAEDLIVYKLASGRAQDTVDVEGIVMIQAPKLDREYLSSRVRELAAGLERPEIVDRLSKLLHAADASSEPTRGDADG